MPFLPPNQQRQSTEGTVLANNNKSAVLCLGKNEGKQSYQIKQANVSFISAMRDLGIITDNKLTVSQHISTTVSEAWARASLIFKCFQTKDRSTLLKAFTTYVRTLRICHPSMVTICCCRHNQNRISAQVFHKVITWTMPLCKH